VAGAAWEGRAATKHEEKSRYPAFSTASGAGRFVFPSHHPSAVESLPLAGRPRRVAGAGSLRQLEEQLFAGLLIPSAIATGGQAQRRATSR